MREKEMDQNYYFFFKKYRQREKRKGSSNCFSSTW
jgi:hypothetical protein